jgi:hypothetical protein
MQFQFYRGSRGNAIGKSGAALPLCVFADLLGQLFDLFGFFQHGKR